MGMRRLLPLLLAVGLVVAFPALAAAHDAVEKTSPDDGAAVGLLPAAVAITFTEPPTARGAQVRVIGPGGDVVTGAPTVEGRTLSQPLGGRAPAGRYTVAYLVTSSDGHPVSGRFTFSAAVGLDGSTASVHATVPVPQQELPDVTAAAKSQFVPIILTVASALVLVALTVVLVLRGRR